MIVINYECCPMIPKIIHYCWFGRGPQSILIKMCIASWKIRLPDYKFILWDENNFDVNSTVFTKSAYESKKYAFVSDYVRMHALHKYGGIYLDTDVEVFGSFNKLLQNDFFAALEAEKRVGTSVIGAKKEHWLPAAMLELYEGLKFEQEIIKELVNVNHVSRLFSDAGFNLTLMDDRFEQHNNDLILPIGVFSKSKKAKAEYRVKRLARHHYCGSWKIKGKKNIFSYSFNYLKKKLLSDSVCLFKFCIFCTVYKCSVGSRNVR